MKINESIRKLFPSKAVSRSLLEGFARGALWAGIVTTAAILPVFLFSLTTPIPFDEFARAVVALAFSAAGGFVTFASDAGSVIGETFFFESGIRPTLITLLIGFLAYRAGGRVKEFRSGDVSLRLLSGMSSIGLGFGFAGVLYVLSIFAQGSIDALATISLEPLGLKSILWMFLVVALPAWLGSMSYVGRKSTSNWKWVFASLRTFAALYLALILVAITVFLIYQWISPDWGPSAPELSAAPGFKFEWSQLGLIALAILGFLIVLPAILFTILLIGMGANFALQFDFLGSDVLSSIASMIPGLDISAITNVSVLATLGPWPFVAVLVAVVIVSLISGAKASGKFGGDRAFSAEFLKVGIASLLIGLVALSVSEIYLSWTNLGKPIHQLTDGELPLQEGFVSLGISTVSISLILVAVSIFVAVGATHARSFMADSFPRLYSGSLVAQRQELPSAIARIFGAITSLIVLAGIVVPISVAAVERVWASTDGPAQFFEEIAKTTEGDDIQKTKKLFGFKDSEAESWLPDEVLISARPTNSQRQAIEVTNFNDDPWKVGNTDAKTTIVWKSEGGEVKLPLVADSQVEESFPLVKHPKFKSVPSSVEIRFSTGPALQAAGQSEVSVNGQSIANGSYKALPGSYEIVVPGFKLIAPSTQRFFTTGDSLDFTSQEIIQLTQAQESVMDKAFSDLAAECEKSPSATQLLCADFSDIYSYRTTESGFEAGDYFAFESRNFDIVEAKCSGSQSDEVRAADVTFRTKECSVAVKFDVEYFDSKLEKRPIIQTQRYNGCPQVAFAFCERFRQVRVGTAEAEVKGKSLGAAKLVSVIPFKISLFGVLDDKGDFTARASWVPPKPVEEPEPEEPKEEPTPIKLLGRYETKQDMIRANPNPRLGDGYIVGSTLVLWVWDGNSWIEIGRR